MLAIRMQRTGRKGHAQYRVVVQDARRSPSSGKIVAYIGNYNPHTKSVKLDKKTASFYLEHGAQPSPSIVRLLKEQKVSLPEWVAKPKKLEGKLRNPEKLRRNRPIGAAEPEKVKPLEEEAPNDTETKEETANDAENVAEEPVEQTDEVATELPADEKPSEIEPSAEEAPTE